MEIIALVISRSPSTTGHSLHPVNGRSVSREREASLSLSGKAKNPLSVIGGIRPAHLLCCKIWDKSGTPNHQGIPLDGSDGRGWLVENDKATKWNEQYRKSFHISTYEREATLRANMMTMVIICRKWRNPKWKCFIFSVSLNDLDMRG